MRILGVIPARFASSRFPGKPLIDIGGKSMIRRVYEQASLSSCLDSVLVATDDQRIFDEVRNFNGQVLMTSTNHRNGTERCGEVLQVMGSKYDFIINIQGDEPFISPTQIDLLAASLEPAIELATLVKKEYDTSLFEDPNTVKVVCDNSNAALLFSRSPIPAAKNPGDFTGFLKHIGIYAYRVDILEEINKLEASPLELTESLEQLRWLENGYKIRVIETREESISIDTPEDLIRVLERTGWISKD